MAIAQQVFAPYSAQRRHAAAAGPAARQAPAAGHPDPATHAAAWQPESHRVYYGTAIDAGGTVLDEVLLLTMLAPRSYTAEDVVEVHTHGGGVSAARVLQRCLEAGARLAQPGEFTLRAFLNGRLDLSQAESVAQVRGCVCPCAGDGDGVAVGGWWALEGQGRSRGGQPPCLLPSNEVPSNEVSTAPALLFACPPACS